MAFIDYFKDYINAGGLYMNKQQDAAWVQQQLAQHTPYGMFAGQQMQLQQTSDPRLQYAAICPQPLAPQIVRRDVARDVGYDADGNAYDGMGRPLPAMGEHPLRWLNRRVDEMRVRL